MDDYKLDFGRLAYVKTEDLSSRLTAVEGKMSDNFTSVYFRFENVDANFGASFKENFSCKAATDIKFSAVISLEGSCEVNFALGGVFLYSQTITGGGEKSLSFEARGLSAGEKTLTVSFLGGNINYADITLSGNQIFYSEYRTGLAHAVNSGGDYVLFLSEEAVKLYIVDGESLTFLHKFEGKAKYCAMTKYAEKLLIFYTVWDGTLFFSSFDVVTKKADLPVPLFFDAAKFSAAEIYGMMYLCFSSNKRFYESYGAAVEGKLIFSDPEQAGVYNIDEPAAALCESRVVLAASDNAGQARIYISEKNIPPHTQAFKIKAAAYYGEEL